MHAFAAYPFTQSADSYANLTARESASTYSSAVLVPTNASVPGQATWRFDTPTDITGATIGGSFITRVDGPDDWVSLSYSWDGVNFNTPATFGNGDLYRHPAPMTRKMPW